MLAAVRVRGDIDVSRKISDTLSNMNLEKRNEVVFYEQDESIEGMMNIAKDYITYGEISEETVEKIEERTGEEVEHGTVVNLSPPTGGFRDTKKQVGQGGALGKRENLDQLIQKMV